MSKEPSAQLAEPSSAVSDNDVLLDESKRKEMFDGKTDESNKKFVEEFIRVLLSCRGVSKNVKTMDILRLAHTCKRIFESQARLIEIDGPVRICGDLHAQFPDLIRLFAQGGFPPDSNYLFLGDYVDRGAYNLEVLLLCLSYKARYPNNFIMLRGNHEQAHINSQFGFKEEIFTRKGEFAPVIYAEITKMMDVMPIVGLIGGRILCMHGGLSKHLKSLEDLRNLKCPFNLEEECLENDLMWSDPGSVKGWEPNTRGASFTFGEDVVHEYCKMLDIDLIVRGHQVVQDGYEFFANKKLVTVFSAPHYSGTFTNSAAVCKVSAGLEVSFEVLVPEDMKVQERKPTAEATAAEPTEN
ncbi:Protein CBG24259 [Caenorhabditis briggsae]|uniref:Serine/threonine-protein phosphatase n=1 Tax=Caenorhabditis briggsae TaxID=6238 RepID=A8WKB7_CAEBR|nr:Protein CBG24259 [Caenorhabditis briggsae]CAP20911.1 Protein CBG24259 [Caenorhabditis briggsae]